MGFWLQRLGFKQELKLAELGNNALLHANSKAYNMGSLNAFVDFILSGIDRFTSRSVIFRNPIPQKGIESDPVEHF